LSGSDFLAFNDSALMNNGGTPVYPQYINFDLLQSAVSIYLSGGSTNDVLRLHAFDGLNGSGTLLDFHLAVAPAGQWVQFAVSAAGIRSVAILPEDDNGIFVADDLEFSDQLNGQIPEPATWLSLTSALGVAVLLWRRNRG
jgi:hypothetical protein